MAIANSWEDDRSAGYRNGASSLEQVLSDPGKVREIAYRLLGTPNAHLSKPHDLRYGSQGSLSIKPSTGEFYNHEDKVGGGLLDLIAATIGGDRAAAVIWLQREGFSHPQHRPRTHRKERRQVAVYSYIDESGLLQFQVVRSEPKDFRQRRPSPDGVSWIWNKEGTPDIPYRLPELLEALACERTIIIVEGEKDADSGWKIGIPSTCNAGGAGKWTSAHASYLKGVDVVVVPDNDSAGRDHRDIVVSSLSGVASRVRVLELPNLPEKGDLTDWITAGGTADEFWQLVATAPDAKQPHPAEAASEPEPDDASSTPWPTLGKESNYGLVGELGALATRDSEADPIAVMATTMAWGAAVFGRGRFMSVGDTHHHPRHFCALVGRSSRARKGTSLDPVRRVFKAAEAELRNTSTLPFPSGLELKISNGPLSSGEGLLNAIRDKRDDDDTGGVQDKRLLCIEGEFGAVLRSCQRQGNTLSSTLRVAWDGWTLEPLTKHDKVCATDPHICVVGHITRHELNELMSVVDIWNGFANRFLWIAVRRRAQVPFPKPMPDDEVARIAAELARVVRYAHSRSGEQARMVLSNSAQAHWADCYSEITAEHTGILGAVTSRAEAQALRLAMTFALFDGADRIEMKHLEAALSFWRYAFDSAHYIFGGAELDPVAQQILEALKSGPKTQTEIWNLFQRNLKKERLNGVLGDLQERGRITLAVERTGGAPRKVWGLTQ